MLDNDIWRSEEHITEDGLQNSSAKLFPENTVLVALYGQGQTRGRTGLLRVPASTNQACCAILPNEELLLPRFTQYWLRSLYAEMREQTHGGAQPNWNAGMINNIQIALPSISEQNAWVERMDAMLTKIGELKHHQAQTAGEMEALLPAVLDKAFKGEL